MKKNYLFYLCVIALVGCTLNDSQKEAEFKPPMNPHGLPYRVGNLGGQPALLGEGVSWLEYEDSPVLVRENRYKGYKAPPRDFNSVITSFAIYMKYTRGWFTLVMVGLQKVQTQQNLQKSRKSNFVQKNIKSIMNGLPLLLMLVFDTSQI